MRHHVGLGHADVERALLIHRCDAGFQSAGRCQVGIDGDHRRVARKDLHRAGDDFGGAIFLCIDRSVGNSAASY